MVLNVGDAMSNLRVCTMLAGVYARTPTKVKLVVGGCLLVAGVAKAVNNSRVVAWKDTCQARIARVCFSRLSSLLSTPLCPEIRKRFQDGIKLPLVVLPEKHSHPESAALRNAANLGLKNLATSMGLIPYCVSNCSNDDGNSGERLIFADRDAHRKIKHDSITERHCLIMVDVDYYADMQYYMSFGVPILIYTFAPESVAGKVPNGTYCINADDEVQYSLSGGVSYKHKLWDYSCDYVRCVGVLDTIVFAVDTYKCSDQTRRIVMLTPTVKIPWYFSWIYNWMVEGRGMRRRTFFSNGFVQSRYMKDDNVYVSFGLPGKICYVDLPEDVFEAVLVRFKASKTKEISTYERMLREAGVEGAAFKAPILFKVLCGGVEKCDAVIQTATSFVPQVAEHFQSIAPLVTEDGKMYARIVSPPIVTADAEVPVESYNNDVACIEGRIKMVENKVEPPARYNLYAQEYVAWVLGDTMGKGCPISYDAVLEHQNTAIQLARAERERFFLGSSSFDVKAFQKRETYAKVSDPRNISTVPQDQTSRLSQFTYAFKEDVLKQQGWYMPCLTPREIADKVRTVCSYFDEVEETDQSRFDGKHSRWIRMNVEFAMYKRWVAKEYLSEVTDLLHRELGARAVTKQGVKYSTGNTRLSGSPVTTDGNTINNGFMNYCTCRESGMEMTEIKWQHLGCCYGDDGFRAKSYGVFRRVCEDLGFSVKLIERNKGNVVGFLGRVFLDPWTNDWSIQDPVRTIRKLHLTMTCDNVPANVAATSRALGYLATDANTPIIGSYCRAVLRVCGYNYTDFSRYGLEPWNNKFWEAELIKDRPYWARDPAIYVNGSWPRVPNAHWLAYEYVATQFQTSVEQLKEYERILDQAQSFDEFPARVLHCVSPSEIQAAKRGNAGASITEGRLAGVSEHFTNNASKTEKPKQHTARFAKRPRQNQNRGGKRSHQNGKSSRPNSGSSSKSS